MSEAVTVTNHPAKDKIEGLWREGFRAAAINKYLVQEGHAELNPQSLGKYGQTHWNTKIDLQWDDDPLIRLQEALAQIDEAGGTVERTTFTQKAYPSWYRENQGEDATSRDAKSTSISIAIKPEVPFPYVRAAKTKIKLGYKPVKSQYEKPAGWKTGVFLPDMQIGYSEVNGQIDCSQDEVAIDLAHQLMAAVQEEEGIDVVVNAGDNADLSAFTTHRSPPGTLHTTQWTIDRISQEGSIQTAIAPDASHWWFQGNHEQRLTNRIVDVLPALHGITRADSSEPILTIPYLCRFDELGINYIDPYPDGKLWLNDNFVLLHGDKHSSTLGTTARNQLAKGVSVGYGHIHRSELLWDRRPTSVGTTPIFAGSPGCLCKITGGVPSARTGLAADGRAKTTFTENWAQGIWVFHYQTDGDQLAFVEPVQFENGFALFRGRPYFGKDRIDG